jgi:hypothetical protein
MHKNPLVAVVPSEVPAPTITLPLFGCNVRFVKLLTVPDVGKLSIVVVLAIPTGD